MSPKNLYNAVNLNEFRTKGDRVAQKLSNIVISHISLVKEGANQKNIIYKSKDADMDNQEQLVNFKVVKNDEKKGVVYGIVYAPDEIDSQGDFASADEIEKAAYNFMKSLNNQNIDTNHDLEKVDAYVAESWIVKDGDPLFKEVGAWAVAIKLESEELKKAAADGTFGGLSMYGKAEKEEVKGVAKADMSLKAFMQALKDVLGYVHFNIGGDVYQTQNDKFKSEENELTPEQIAAAVAEAVKPLSDKVDELSKSYDALAKQNEELKKSNEATQEELKKSKQHTDPDGEVKKSKSEGIM